MASIHLMAIYREKIYHYRETGTPCRTGRLDSPASLNWPMRFANSRLITRLSTLTPGQCYLSTWFLNFFVIVAERAKRVEPHWQVMWMAARDICIIRASGPWANYSTHMRKWCWVSSFRNLLFSPGLGSDALQGSGLQIWLFYCWLLHAVSVDYNEIPWPYQGYLEKANRLRNYKVYLLYSFS